MGRARTYVIITRSREGNIELARKLRMAGYEPIPLNILRFSVPTSWKRVDFYLRRMNLYDWLLFTSSTGVRYFKARCDELGINLIKDRLPKIASVGPRTKDELLKIGLNTDFIPTSFTTASLGKELPQTYGRNVLILRSSLGNHLLSSILRCRGFNVDEVHIYKTEINKLRIDKRVLLAKALLFGSSSAVIGFCSSLTEDILSEVKKRPAFCIGPVTGSTAKELGFQNVVVSPTESFDSLIEMVKVTLAA